MEKTAQALWHDYLFLTKEMLKFFDKQDMELFYHLMNQRGRLQTIIEQNPDDGFITSEAGQNLIKEIEKVNQDIGKAMQIRMGKSKRQHQVVKAYGAASTTAVSQMNWKR